MEKAEIKKPVRWTEKFFKIVDMGPEPPLNREGFWKKYEPTKIEIKEEDG
ncbi:MAG: hypothetical protein KAX30_04295 [Candidatus Atribacteria bacterium]|nr:hypothetical protein [Candidatus Atribacteria bacterium]